MENFKNFSKFLKFKNFPKNLKNVPGFGRLRGSLSTFVRFNIQQALFLDLLLILPFLFPELSNWVLHTAGPGALILARSSTWLAWVSVVGYAAVCNARGRLPDQLPMLSPAAKAILESTE